jgi:hypothetical protein
MRPSGVRSIISFWASLPMKPEACPLWPGVAAMLDGVALSLEDGVWPQVLRRHDKRGLAAEGMPQVVQLPPKVGQ